MSSGITESIYVNYSNDWSYLISVAVIQALEESIRIRLTFKKFFGSMGLLLCHGLFLDVVKGLVEHGV